VNEKFIDEDEESIDCSPEYLDIDNDMQDDDISDKENNDPKIFKLQNSKIYRRKRRPPGIKWFKSTYEILKVKTNQRWCKKCGIIGHY